jgi:hypothetical protein
MRHSSSSRTAKGNGRGHERLKRETGESTTATQIWIKGMLDRPGVDYEERQHRAAFTAQEVP